MAGSGPCVRWLARCPPFLCCQRSQTVLIRAELSLPFSQTEHKQGSSFLMFAMELDRSCISKSSASLLGLVETGQKVGELILGDASKKKQHLCKTPFFRKGKCKQQGK